MFGTCIGYEMCQCKTMSGTWHWHGDVRASVRPCLGHGINLMDERV
ncbi:GPI mannosyltransferase 3 [Gossypium arboreum]|uniref:GPI mannosyltransferase 3 n=1 Tax=Gossypium arboreum TaxID=29729 RepID=A0A0B0NJI1_GOSAR|nr:GPI mannosyltransferase 3 [Gossypium arboreum]